MVHDKDFEIRLEGKRGYVYIHAKSDTNKRKQHIEAAQILADKGLYILLMPEVHFRDEEDRQYFFQELNNSKNPDVRNPLDR